jgi:hypothetical protein
MMTLLSVASLVGAVVGVRGQDPPPEPANRENIEAALKLTRASADEYEFKVGDDEKPLELVREPVLRWSNPDRGEVHGNVFVWTRGGRPLMVGSLFKWFTPWTHMTHEFQSLAEGPFVAKFHGKEVWKTDEAGLKFADLAGAPVPAGDEARMQLQMRQLARDFSGDKREKEDAAPTVLRLLPQPVYRYSAPKESILAGGLFTLVHGTDPEIWILIEARGKDAKSARWQFAAARMNNVVMNLKRKGETIWTGDWLLSKDVNGHTRSYTKFGFDQIPDFLTEAVKQPKP